MHKIMIGSLRLARQAVVAVIGATVLLIGLLMIVLPGPAIIMIPAGLAILATEFVWARRLLRRVKRTFRNAGNGFGKRREEEKRAAGKSSLEES